MKAIKAAGLDPSFFDFTKEQGNIERIDQICKIFIGFMQSKDHEEKVKIK